MAAKKLQVGDQFYSSYFKKQIRITRIISDDHWYFRFPTGGAEYKAGTPLSYFERQLSLIPTEVVNRNIESDKMPVDEWIQWIERIFMDVEDLETGEILKSTPEIRKGVLRLAYTKAGGLTSDTFQV